MDAVSDESDTTNNCSTSVQVTVPEPKRPDLMVTSPSVSDSRPVTGTSFTLSATVSNGGDGTAPATTLRYYRSTDATITTSDTQLASDAVAEIAAGGSGSHSVDLVSPSAQGTYYYGACVQAVADESDKTNNCSASVEVDVQVAVVEPQGQPDLTVTSVTVTDSSPITGASFKLSATVRNDGDGAAAATTLRYYRSTDATITMSDREVGTDAISGLGAGGSSSESADVTAPATAGAYYYGACVDAVTGESDTTDNCSASVKIDVENPKYPDLEVETPTVDDTIPQTSATITLSATVSNAGDAASASTTLRYYRSTDATITTSDTQVGTDSVGALAASGTSAESISLTAPATAGAYYYGACVDAVTDESDTTDNCSASVRIDVENPKYPDLEVETPTVDDTTPQTSATITLSATVSNTGDGRSAAATLRYYRSADATITTSDTQVGTDSVGALAASGTSAESISLTAPATAGAYYYGACVDAVTDESDTTDNCSASVKIDVENPKYPDLEVETPTVDDTTPQTSATITLSATVSNTGDGRSAAATLRYYRSTDATITTSDTQVGTDSVGALAASGTSAESISLTAPATAGAYYYGACVDAVTGESDTTDNCSASVRIDVENPKYPDLEVETPTVDDTTPQTSATITLSATVSNTGDGRSAAATLRYYRSADATITTSDTQVGTDSVGALAASGTSAESISLTAPATAGAYYYGACVDAVTGESDTTNNCSASVTVTASHDDDDDHGDSQQSATTVVPATVNTAQDPISGHLETDGDVDYFRVVADSGETVSAILDASAQPGNHVYRAFVRIESPISTSSDSSTTVYVRVWSRRGTPTYSLAIWIRDANDPKDTTFDIELMYSSTAQPTASQKAIFRAAADKWESVITEGLDARLISISNMCRNGNTHDFGSWVDDLLIDIRVESIDGAGGVWASAATCTIRTHSSGLPYTSEVTFDSADINRLSSGNLRILALHEMGHALGFGTLDAWDESLVNSAYDYHRENPTSTTLPDTHFLGTAAVSAFNEIADSYTGGKVPVENDTQSYSSGSWDSHWRESVFRTEVMDSVVSSTAEKLSKVTIAALADLGYSVDYSQAESYTLPSSSALHPSPLNIRDEVRRGPVTALPFRDRQIVVIPP